MLKELDCRGLACPAPVLQTKQLLEKENPGAIKILVDNEAARQNVTRFLEHQQFQVTVEKQGAVFHLIGTKSGEEAAPVEPRPDEAEHKRIMVLIASDRVGRGDDTLGSKLMASFLKTLKEMGPDLWRLVLVNNGVKLTVEGSDVLASLKELEHQGVDILVCGTCLNHFNLMDRIRVGQTTNMLDIVTSMQVADKTINLD